MGVASPPVPAAGGGVEGQGCSEEGAGSASRVGVGRQESSESGQDDKQVCLAVPDIGLGGCGAQQNSPLKPRAP